MWSDGPDGSRSAEDHRVLWWTTTSSSAKEFANCSRRTAPSRSSAKPAPVQTPSPEFGRLDHRSLCLDVQLPDGSGVEVCRDVRSLDPDLVCLMLTSFSDEEALFQSVHGGSSRIRVEADPRQRPGLGSASRGPRGVADRSGGHRSTARSIAEPATRPRPPVGCTDRARTDHSRPGCRRSHQSPDRCEGQSRRKDRQELHVVDPDEVGYDPQDRGRGLCRSVQVATD